MNKTDKEKLGKLIQSIAQGNSTAIHEIYSMTNKVIKGIAKSIVSAADVDDVIHESLIKIVMNAEKFRTNDNAYAWINKIVKNTAYDISRRNNRKKEVVAEQPEEAYEYDHEEFILREALAALSPKERDLIVYAYWYGLSLSEISELTGMPKSTVEYKLHKALKNIKKFL